MAYSYTWPASLPQAPLLAGYGESFGMQMLSTPMDKGPAKRRVLGRKPEPLTTRWMMTTAQLATLRTFVETTLGGVARFGLPHPRTREVVEARIVPDSEGVLYRLTPGSRRIWYVDIDIEVMP